MHIIIDGYNLLRRNPKLNRLAIKDLKRAREHLLARLIAYKRIRGAPITVVFDAWGGGGVTETSETIGGIEVVYSSYGEKADEILKRMARREREGAIIVTSDREVAQYAISQDATVISSGGFEQKMDRAFYDKLIGIEPKKDEEEPIQSKKKGPSKMLKKSERRARKKLEKL